MELLFATTNPHKAKEIEQILSPLGVTVLGIGNVESAGEIPAPLEDGESFEENARLKACYYARVLGRPCLADDSGLEVDALGGQPGVLSARYAGRGSSRSQRDQFNREKLIAELQALGEVERRARLVCTLCLANSDGSVLFESRGSCEGTIVDEPAGDHGFGYDTHLWLSDVGRTAAQLSPAEWNLRSHRARALARLFDYLRQQPLR